METSSTDGWATFIPAHAPRTPAEALAIVSEGGLDLRITPQAVALLGDTKMVKLFYDRAGPRVGLKPAQTGDRNAYPVKRYGQGQLYHINFQAFRQWAQIEIKGRQMFPVEVYEDGFVGFSLGSALPGPFEPFEYKNAVISQLAPNVSIPRSARNMTLNQAARMLLGESVERVTLLYHAERNLIGIRPAASNDVNAMPVRQYPSTHGWAISTDAFVKSFGISHPEGQSYTPVREDGVLVIDLGKPKVKRKGSEV